MERRGLVIFDLDGTLFRTETVTVPAVEQTFRHLGLPVPSREEICSFFGRPVSAFHAWLRSLAPRHDQDAAVAAVDHLELELIPQTGELYPHVQQVLTTLRASVEQMALCTNGSWEYVWRVVAAHDLKRFFDAIRCRQSDRDTKPLMIRELLSQLKGRPAVVVGDRHDDIEAAHENGIRAIAATYGYGSPEELEQADAAAIAPSDISRLVVRWTAPDAGESSEAAGPETAD